MVIRPGIESEPITPKSGTQSTVTNSCESYHEAVPFRSVVYHSIYGGSDVKLKKASSMTIRESLYTVIFRELL